MTRRREEPAFSWSYYSHFKEAPMTPRFALPVALMLSMARSSAGLAQSVPADRAADAAAIRAHIESICQAFVDKDVAKLRATHGENWRGFTPFSGHVIRGIEGYMNEATFAPGTPKGEG